MPEITQEPDKANSTRTINQENIRPENLQTEISSEQPANQLSEKKLFSAMIGTGIKEGIDPQEILKDLVVIQLGEVTFQDPKSQEAKATGTMGAKPPKIENPVSQEEQARQTA